MKKWSLILSSLAAMVLAFSCKQVEEFQDVEIVSGDAEFAIPLVKAGTSFSELLDNFDDYTDIEITPDGIIHLRYTGEVYSQTSRAILDSAEAQIPPIIPLGDTLFALPFSQPEEFEVDKAVYKSGTITFGIVSTLQDTIDFTLTMPQVTKNGVPLSFHQTIKLPNSLFIAFPKDVKGYTLEPLNDSIYVHYSAINTDGERIVLDSIGLISQNVHFSYIEGYLGNEVHDGERDTIQIEFFENWVQGDVYFEDPLIEIYIENSFGIPTRSEVEVFDILRADAPPLPLESPFITNGIDLVYPDLDHVGETRTMTFAFTKDNSNIDEVLGSRPIALDYEINALTNPDNNTDVRGYLTDSSFYKIQVRVDLPLYGKASGFGVVDTFDIDFSGYDDFKSVEFKMVADNGMPLDIDAQVIFMDENGVVLDSLFEDKKRIVGSAIAGTDGIVTAPTTQVNFAPMTGERFDKIRDAKKLALQAFFSTFNEGQQSIKAFSDQEVEIRMGMKLVR